MASWIRHIRAISPVMFGLFAGIVYTYVIGILDSADYLVEQWSVWIIEVPFMAAWALFDRKFGWRMCLLYAFVGTGLSFALSLPDRSVAPLVYFKIVLTGIILGEAEWFGGSFTRRLTAVAFPGAVLAFVLGIPLIVGGVGPEIMDRFRQEALDMYRAFMSEDEALKAVENAMLMFRGIFKAGLGIFLIGSVTNAWLSFLAVRPVMAKFGEDPEGIPSFHDFRLPFHVIWLFLAAFGLLLSEIGLVFPVAMNLLIVTACLYMMQGLAVVVYYMNRLGVGRLPRVLFWLLFFVTIAFTGLVLLFIGLFDTWFHLRSRGTAGAGQEKG
ncbi:MAG: DUF2232 domain-containing protein [Candidatus Latescibacteria bacterium]|nr:DUF2232 domain-containing protein [Candidatus Latescibacterota bacterium]